MADSQSTKLPIGTWLGLLAIGAGIGWLLGMSTSPVLSIVITSLTGAAGAVIAVLSGLEDYKAPAPTGPDDKPVSISRRVHVAPLVALVIGIVAGAMFGLWSRSSGWLGTDLDAEVSKWTKHGRTEQEVTAALFAAAFPTPDSGQAPIRPWSDDQVGVLFSSYAELSAACPSLLILDGADLRKQAQGSSLETVQRIAAVVEDPSVLKAVLEAVCPAN
jgi:hypothetical protein